MVSGCSRREQLPRKPHGGILTDREKRHCPCFSYAGFLASATNPSVGASDNHTVGRRHFHKKLDCHVLHVRRADGSGELIARSNSARTRGRGRRERDAQVTDLSGDTDVGWVLHTAEGKVSVHQPFLRRVDVNYVHNDPWH